MYLERDLAVEEVYVLGDVEFILATVSLQISVQDIVAFHQYLHQVTETTKQPGNHVTEISTRVNCGLKQCVTDTGILYQLKLNNVIILIINSPIVYG